jgi:FAS-associated factor 2
MAARHENLQESFFAPAAAARMPRRQRTEPAPRIVPPRPVTHRAPFLFTLIFAPFNLGIKLFSTVFRSIYYLFSFLPQSIRPRAVTNTITRGLRNTNGRKMLLPRDCAARFKREFEEEYGPTTLPFYEGGFAQALDLAKRDLKFLLMVLMSPEHDDTASFTRETLLAPEVVAFINDPANNIILWGGNVLDSEAFQVSLEYNCTKFPFTALVCLTPKEGSTRMGIIKRLAGPMPAGSYLAAIQTAIGKYASDLDGVRAERTANEVARNLRSEQDSAYERSLARDRERARQKREAEEAAAAAERRAREEAEAAALLERKREQWRRWRATTIIPEPEAGAKDIVRLALKMPEASGAGRIVRRFPASTTMEELYAFVECYEFIAGAGASSDEKAAQPDGYQHQYKFRIASVMPREVYEPVTSATVGEKIGRSGNLIVEDVAPDDDDEE